MWKMDWTISRDINQDPVNNNSENKKNNENPKLLTCEDRNGDLQVVVMWTL